MTFGTHGTFYLRDGWINKIFENVSEDEGIFSDDNAAVQLGIGHNMVTAMRFWGEATGIINYKRDGVQWIAEITNFGQLIMEEDPFLEKIETLWLFHYNMATSIDKTSTWYWIFNIYDDNYIQKDKFSEIIAPWIETNYKNTGNRKPKIAKSTLKKDIRCFIQTYNKSSKVINPENNLISPLSELDIIVEDSNQIIFKTLSKDEIPINIFEFVLYNYLQNKFEGLNNNHEENTSHEVQVNVRELMRDKYSPGRILRCSTNTLYELLTKAIQREKIGNLYLERTAGLDVVRAEFILNKSDDLLKSIYR